MPYSTRYLPEGSWVVVPVSDIVFRALLASGVPDEGVDYAVVETGMGGLYDATNVAGRPDKLC